MFFGTAEPTQPDDPPQTPLVDENAGRNELDHNSLEFTAGESGQWRDMQVSVMVLCAADLCKVIKSSLYIVVDNRRGIKRENV